MSSSAQPFQFFARRLGLFIHWGIYATPGYHEQHQQRLFVPRAEYGKWAGQFCPDRFDADAWVLLAKKANMDYLVFTTKHHDGFCLWDTKETAFSVMNTPYGKDVVAKVATACARHGLKFGIYYSCVDWHHPNYPNEGRHHELPGPEAGDQPDMERYLDFVRAQVRELCDGRYGEISVFWWDMNVPEHRDPSVNALIKQLQPGCQINNRGYGEGDFSTPERDWDSDQSWKLFEKNVEACNSIDSQSWGFRVDPVFYTTRHFEASIGKYLARGGNYLLNVGPDASGTITAPYASRVMEIGDWFGRVREALIGTDPVKPLPYLPSQIVTRRGNTLYIQIVEPPVSEGICLKPIVIAPERATLLNTGESVPFEVDCLPYEIDRSRNFLRLKLPEPTREVAIIKLEFAADPLEERDQDGSAELARL